METTVADNGRISRFLDDVEVSINSFLLYFMSNLHRLLPLS